MTENLNRDLYIYINMQFTVKQLAELLGGTIEGNPEAILRTIGRIEDAGEGELAFLSNPKKYAEFAYDSKATALLVAKDFNAERAFKATVIRVDDVQNATAGLLRMYAANLPKPQAGVDPSAFVHESATVHPSAHIGAFAYVGEKATIGSRTILEPQSFVGTGATLGEDCLIQTGARLLHGCVVGNRVRLLANCVVGTDGFGHTREADGAWIRIPHLGNVLIEDDVEVGACTTIDRSITGSTILRRGVKLDNLVMVAHNVTIDEHTAAAAQVGIAGSAKLGKRIQLGGQVGMAGHIVLADGVEVAAQSGLKDSILEEGSKVFGSPAKPFRTWAAEQSSIRRIPKMMEQLKELKKELEALKKESGVV